MMGAIIGDIDSVFEWHNIRAVSCEKLYYFWIL